VKFAKLSKGTIPCTIALVAAAHVMPETHISVVSAGTRGAKGGERRPGSQTVPEVKAAPPAKKCIIPAIGALAVLSSDGTEESPLHDRASEVQSKADPHGLSTEPQAPSATTSGLQPTSEVSLRIVPSAGTAGASTGCF
jgi:hypothetical protein